ncbi:hypothetical protein ACFFV7_47205 [Nonomuraea spiralis]|uniref:Secreted protein n=1 Tax=Nonomuraea spiralis TaxID=46182 RepID=A0ABV5IWA3_9ACTN|nr:hypothetical protein [Nonomuraea spiralis]GGS85483.1 hypothetical protein GCM10010176_031530 [Nonomuraea spiralis]
MTIWKRSLGIAGIALALAAAAPLTTASAATSATAASHWETVGYYWGPDAYENCHRDGQRSVRAYRCFWDDHAIPNQYELQFLIF